MPQILHPTVKRNISLFSVLAWEKGYTSVLKKNLGWHYDIFFHYDGEKVNFYHRQTDYDYFKKVITQKLLDNDSLFNLLNSAFKSNILELKNRLSSLAIADLPSVSVLIGEIMSFYIFIVSDAFLEKRPEAWESRNISEGILYEADKKIEEIIQPLLEQQKLDIKLSHFLSLDEIRKLRKGSLLAETVHQRIPGYIVFNNTVISDKTFEEFCKEHGLVNPENLNELSHTLQGKVAYLGTAKGPVKIIKNTKDIPNVRIGDIIVSIMTNVNYLPAMKKAGGVITDEGGIACHAAIAAREFKIPTITGTKNATKILKDGDIVQMDGITGIVTIIKKHNK